MRRKDRRPEALILTSPALLPHFFPEHLLGRLSTVVNWTVTHESRDTPELRARLASSDVLLTTWHSPFLKLEMLGRPPRVRLIAHAGGEIRSRMDEQVVRTITVTNAPAAMANPVAEMALAMVLTLLRRLPEYGREMQRGLILPNTKATEGETLIGKQVGLIGFGRIGQAFARLVRPFAVDLVVYDPYCTREVLKRHRCRTAGIDQILELCPVIVLTAALTAETRGLLDRRRLALLQDGACLVNVARGGVIEMDALVESLGTGRFRGALDVTDPLEPLPVDHPLRSMSNVLLTPHIAAGGLEVRRAMGAEAAEQVISLFRGLPIRNIVTPEMLSLMT
jgi:phosphoglycerate dehydrogenase-like enzyme